MIIFKNLIKCMKKTCGSRITVKETFTPTDPERVKEIWEEDKFGGVNGKITFKPETKLPDVIPEFPPPPSPYTGPSHQPGTPRLHPMDPTLQYQFTDEEKEFEDIRMAKMASMIENIKVKLEKEEE